MFRRVPSILLTLVDQFSLDIDGPACCGAAVKVKVDYKLQPKKPYDRRLIEAFLVNAVGVRRRIPCGACAEGLGMFVKCCTLEGFVSGVCGNCKRREKGLGCAFHTEQRLHTKDRDFVGDLNARMATEEVTTGRGRRTVRPVDYAAYNYGDYEEDE